MDKQQIEALRLTLLANGYSPIRNRDKATYMPAWPSVEITPEVIHSWSRMTRDRATGIRVENGLAVIDIDIDDQEIVDTLADAILDIAPELDVDGTPLLVRTSGRAKEAWFVRTDEPFGRIHARRWVKAGETLDDGSHTVEIFGGASPRQMGSFGPHTVERDGTVTREYAWNGDSPETVPLADLPVLTKKQFFAIADKAEEIMKAAGWEPVALTEKGENTTQRVYDLADDMLFDVHEGPAGISLSDLKDMAEAAHAAEEGVRVSASWLEGPDPRRSPDRCLVSITRTGHLAIWDSATGVTHVEASAAPMDFGPEIDRIAEKLRELDERRRRKIKPVDDLTTAVAKMLDVYAYCPNQQQDVVPMWASSADDGKQINKFRLEMLRNAQEEVGPRGGRRLINPVDVWLRHERLTVVAGVRMRPDQPRPTFEENGRRYVNCYDPPLHLADGGDATLGLEFMEHLIPDERERRWFMQWLAFKLRHPNIPGPAVVMVAHRTFGTGRGTLGILCGKLFGVNYVRNIAFEDFTGKTYQSQYNEWQGDALLVMVNESSEIREGSAFTTKRNTYEHLKEIVEVRPTMREVKTKRERNYRALSSTSFIIATNHADALPIPEHDRRFCVIQNGGTKPEEWWVEINAWLETPAHVAAFYEHLKSLDLTGYSPYATPPVFAGKQRMIDDNRSDLDEAFELALQTLPGEAMTLPQIEAAVRKAFAVYNLEQPQGNLGQTIKRMAKRELHRIGERHGPNYFVKEAGARYAIYARSAEIARRLTTEDHDTVAREVKRNGDNNGGSSGPILNLPRRA